MGYVINMPKLEMGMNQGTLLEWFVLAGESVSEGDVLAEIESEKTITEITAREDGILREIYVEAGETVAPGTSLGIVAAAGADIESLRREADREPEEATEAGTESGGAAPPVDDGPGGAGGLEDGSDRTHATPRARRLAAERNVDLGRIEGSGPEGAVVAADVPASGDSTPVVEATTSTGTNGETGSTGDVGMEPKREPRATPKARRRARELGVELTDVDGSGPKGAITAADIEAVGEGAVPTAAGGNGKSSSNTGTAAELEPVEIHELSGMRRTIAERLGRSYREAVHVTLSRVVDAEELLRATEIADGYLDARVSMTDLLLLAVSETLREHPSFNARFEDGTVELYDRQNVGIAVDVDRGLVTPVLRDLDSKLLADVVADRRALTERAVADEATMADMSGGTFTVSNLGVFGVDSFDPVINPPQVAILGVTRLRNRPVEADDGGVEFRRHIGFDLSFDHRVVDGADAARALDTLAGHVRDPWSILLERT